MKPVYINSISSISPQHSFVQQEGINRPVEKKLAAIEPDYKTYITDAGLRRRMSRIIKIGVTAALDCLNQISPVEPDAIITATGLGCLADTEKFMVSILDNEERLLNPTAFIQSTFNTIGAQIALICKNHNYNMTYVHRGFSFENALLDAQMMLADGDARQVLTGAVDEMTPTQFRVMERMGFWKNTVAGEGAQFFVLGVSAMSDSFAVLRGVDTFCGPVSADEVCVRIRKFLGGLGVNVDEVGVLLTGRAGNAVTEPIYDRVHSDLFPGSLEIPFKAYCGEYQTASSFAMWMATRLLRGYRVLDIPAIAGEKYILIYNTYREVNHALILLEKI